MATMALAPPTCLLPTRPSTAVPPSRFSCLQVRLLWEKCGHIHTLTIHELPCAGRYRGWLPESSPYISATPCPVMTRHLALKRSVCERCAEAAAAAAAGVPKRPRGVFGWGEGQAEMQQRGERKGLPIAEIVARRREWLLVMRAQEERRRIREEGRGF